MAFSKDGKYVSKVAWEAALIEEKLILSAS